jgi:RNA polymerase sigma-70 factor (ECF subfamily)
VLQKDLADPFILSIRMFLKIPGKKSRSKADEVLLTDFRSAGDPEVLGELYSRYVPLVYGVCLKYLKEREEAKDAVIQIFEKLIIEIPKHNIENFRSWLHVVTKNYCLMQLRSDKSEKEKLSEWINDPAIFMETVTDLHPLDEDENSDLMDKALEDCIEKLKEEQRKCIRQFYFENRCYNEISVNLGIDEKKVKSHLQNGKRNLKLCLEEKNVRKR